ASRVRGGPHVQRLAGECAVALAAAGSMAAVAPALRLTSGVRDAVGMGAAARASNLAGRVLAVPAGCPPAGSAVVVLDDVLTTGATAAAVIRALMAANLQVTAVLTLTSPRLRPPRPSSGHRDGAPAAGQDAIPREVPAARAGPGVRSP
ncbi:MAG: ComF family protein, partial [Thermocrispum sp.]